ncbi:MAG: phosphoribosylaminoimidazolesuccinocarboxamide synthase [Spirochaetes bacterium]|nr:phosphoribosylaminoimidazolesuccinocarboxamide synthase [Spirochaetota bacterium]
MNTIYEGKTKSVLKDEITSEHYLLFKDSATGEDGVFDPGSNTVGGSVSGKGRNGLVISKYFFELMEKNGVPTHYLGADIDKCLMKVQPVMVPKLEFVLRYFTAGSICRRFSIDPGIPFDPPYAEVMLKDDDQGDPLISERLCVMKGLLKEGEYQKAIELLIKVGEILRAELKKFGLVLIDFKIEVGFDEQRNIYVADEITPDIWRVKDASGNIPDQIECARVILKSLAELLSATPVASYK